MPGLFVESKAVEKLSVHPVMMRAVQEAGSKLAVLAHKKNRTGWLLTMRLEDAPAFVEMVKAALPSMPGEPSGQPSPSDST